MLLLRLKRRHVLLFAGWCVLWVSTSSWFLVLFKFSIFLLIFCIVVLSIIENRYVFKLWLPRWLGIHLQCRRCRFDLWVGKIPWRRAWQSTPVFLPGEAHGQSMVPAVSRNRAQLTQPTTYAPNNGAAKYIKQKLTELKEKQAIQRE